MVRSQTLERSSTAVRVARVLRDRIAAGRIAPGERIVELDVSGELGVSRSPVREALRELAQEGLIEIVPYRGAVVVPLDAHRFTELTEFRLALERFALDRLMANDPYGALARLRPPLAKLRAAARRGDRTRAIDADLGLHRAMVKMAGNALLARAYDGLLAQIRLYISVTAARYERLEELADEHEALLAAIEDGGIALAHRLLDQHILHGFERDGAAGAGPGNFATAQR